VHTYIWIRFFGPYAWAGWTTVVCNCILPNLFWFKSIRRNLFLMFVLSITTNIGMWFERYVIIVTSLAQDFLPSSWGYFTVTAWDLAMFAGSVGLFFVLFLLFARFVPTIAVAEVKGVLRKPVGEAAPVLEESNA
jgi:molybdopterin-containing oxidoreductase family membrane subunit